MYLMGGRKEAVRIGQEAAILSPVAPTAIKGGDSVRVLDGWSSERILREVKARFGFRANLSPGDPAYPSPAAFQQYPRCVVGLEKEHEREKRAFDAARVARDRSEAQDIARMESFGGLGFYLPK